MCPQTSPAPLPRIQATSAYRRAVGSIRIALASGLVFQSASMATAALQVPRGVIRALAIVDVVAAVGFLVAAIGMTSAHVRLEREFPGLLTARRMWALQRVMVRHAVTLRTPDKDL